MLIYFFSGLGLLLVLIFVSCRFLKKNEITSNKGEDDFDEKIYSKRINWLFVYLFLSLSLFFFLYNQDSLNNFVTDQELLKLLFCVASGFIGLFLNGFKWRMRSKADPIPNYIFLYPFLLLAFSAFLFSGITIFLKKVNISSEIVFYTLAFPLNIFFAYYVDNVKGLIKIIKLKDS